MKGRVLSPGRLVTLCLVQFGAYIAILNPLGGQLVTGVNKRKLVHIMGVNTNLITLSTNKKHEGCIIYLHFTYYNHKKRLHPVYVILPQCSALWGNIVMTG